MAFIRKRRALSQRAASGPSVLLCGNPNVGKSTVFNSLTGLCQHTGNWTGKTVETARGSYRHGGEVYSVTDLPGCYSLDAASPEEAVARDAVLAGIADCTVVVCDALCIERSLLLALQVLSHTKAVVLCINFMAAAKKQGVHIDAEALGKLLGIETVVMDSVSRAELCALKEAVARVVTRVRDGIIPRAGVCRCCDCRGCEECRALLWKRAAGIAEAVTKRDSDAVSARRLKLDRLLTGKVTGRLAVLLLLGLVLYITMAGSNLPSQWLSVLLEKLLEAIRGLLTGAGLPEKLISAICDGVLYTLFTVVSVMLPPMAIFFPLFSLLEDAGLLPRFAFCLDRSFERCRSCGKQALTMCMGLGCNAVGVTGCRIIGDGRERLAAILTNSLMPCNGRFPALIALTAVLAACMGVKAGGAFCALMLVMLMLLSLAATLVSTRLLTGVLPGEKNSSFILELPPYRRPRFLRVILRSLADRALKVLARAAVCAVPAGLVIWLLSELGALRGIAEFLEPVGKIMGLDGNILLGFILGLPANELILPLIVMISSGAGSLGAASVGAFSGGVFGEGWVTPVCMTLLTLFHSPCLTTLLTVKHETGSFGHTLLALAIPSAIGVLLCIAVKLVSVI